MWKRAPFAARSRCVHGPADRTLHGSPAPGRAGTGAGSSTGFWSNDIPAACHTRVLRTCPALAPGRKPLPAAGHWIRPSARSISSLVAGRGLAFFSTCAVACAPAMVRSGFRTFLK